MRRRAILKKLSKPAILTRRLISLVVRTVVITTMSFGVAFGFLSGATSKMAHYDPNTFAIGVAALFGAACGAMGILYSRVRQMKGEMRNLEAGLERAADRTWEISEALLPLLRPVLAGPRSWDSDDTIRRSIEIRDGVVQNPRILSFQHRSPGYPHELLPA